MAGANNNINKTAGRRLTTGSFIIESGKNLSRKILPQERNIIVGKNTNELLIEVVGRSHRSFAISLVVRCPAFLDVFLEPLVQIAIELAFHNSGLIVQLNLFDQ